MTFFRTATFVAVMVSLSACGNQDIVLPGERTDLRPEAEQSAEQSENRSEPIRLGVQVSHAAWTHRGGSSTHTVAHPAFSNAPALLWSVSIGEGDGRRHRITADPVVADGRIYVMDSRSQVSAVSDSGAVLWSSSAVPGFENADDATGGGLAVLGGHVYATTGFGTLVKLDAVSGEILWTHRFEAVATSAPTVQGELVYVMTRDGVAHAVERDTGRLRWTLRGIPSGANVIGGAGAVATRDIAVFPFAAGDLIASFPLGGVRRWATSIAGERSGATYARILDVTGDPVISGNTLFAGSSAGRLAAINATTGERIWTVREGAMGPVWPAGGSVFVINDQNMLLRLDARDGSRVWGVEMGYYQRPDRPRRRQEIDVHYGPVLAGGLIWVASSDEALRAYAPEDGALVNTLELPDGATTNMAVVNGTLYVVNTDGALLAFR